MGTWLESNSPVASPRGVHHVEAGVVPVGDVGGVDQFRAHVRHLEELLGLLEVRLPRQRVEPRGVEEAAAGEGVDVAQLGRHVVRVALGQRDHRLAPLAQPAQVDGQRLQGGQADVVADHLDRGGRIVRIHVLVHVARLVVVLDALEGLEGPDHLVVVAGEPHAHGRRQGVHDPDEVGRPQLRLDELDEGRPRPDGVGVAHVVVVEEEHEDARVRPRRLALLVVVVADAGRRRQRGVGLAGDLDQAEGLDGLLDVVLEDSEVVLGQIEHGIAVLVGDDGVDAHEIDAGPEHRGLRPPVGPRRRRGVGAAGPIGGRSLLFLGGRAGARQEHPRGHERRGRPPRPPRRGPDAGTAAHAPSTARHARFPLRGDPARRASPTAPLAAQPTLPGVRTVLRSTRLAPESVA